MILKLCSNKKMEINKKSIRGRMVLKYSFVPNCRGGGQIAHFLENNPQVHLIIVRE